MQISGFLNSSLTRVTNPYEQDIVQKTAENTEKINKKVELTSAQKSLITQQTKK
jgi:hypothetical protein